MGARLAYCTSPVHKPGPESSPGRAVFNCGRVAAVPTLFREAFQEPDEDTEQIKSLEQYPPLKAVSERSAPAVTELIECNSLLTCSQTTVVAHDNNTCPVRE